MRSTGDERARGQASSSSVAVACRPATSVRRRQGRGRDTDRAAAVHGVEDDWWPWPSSAPVPRWCTPRCRRSPQPRRTPHRTPGRPRVSTPARATSRTPTRSTSPRHTTVRRQQPNGRPGHEHDPREEPEQTDARASGCRRSVAGVAAAATPRRNRRRRSRCAVHARWMRPASTAAMLRLASVSPMPTRSTPKTALWRIQSADTMSGLAAPRCTYPDSARSVAEGRREAGRRCRPRRASPRQAAMRAIPRARRTTAADEAHEADRADREQRGEDPAWRPTPVRVEVDHLGRRRVVRREARRPDHVLGDHARREGEAAEARPPAGAGVNRVAAARGVSYRTCCTCTMEGSFVWPTINSS